MYARRLSITIAPFPSLLALNNFFSPPYIVFAVLVTPHRTPPCQRPQGTQQPPVYFTEEAEEAEEEKEKEMKKFEKESTRKK
jgi:hypothetical protein